MVDTAFMHFEPRLSSRAGIARGRLWRIVEGGLAAVLIVFAVTLGRTIVGGCLNAILSQTYPVDEVIVVDNASQDQSRALLSAQYPRVRVIALERNDGPAPARNVGLREARNRWVLLVDNDAVLAPDVLAKLVSAASQAPRAAICQPRSVLDSEPGRVHYDGGRFHYAGLFSLRNFYCPLELAEGRGTLEVDGAVSVALLTDRDVLLEWGGFDESFEEPSYFGDNDLCARARARGMKLVEVPVALRHLGNWTAKRERLDVREVSARNYQRYAARVRELAAAKAAV